MLMSYFGSTPPAVALTDLPVRVCSRVVKNSQKVISLHGDVHESSAIVTKSSLLPAGQTMPVLRALQR